MLKKSTLNHCPYRVCDMRTTRTFQCRLQNTSRTNVPALPTEYAYHEEPEVYEQILPGIVVMPTNFQNALPLLGELAGGRLYILHTLYMIISIMYNVFNIFKIFFSLRF